MSDIERVRQQTRTDFVRNPQTPMVTPQQEPDYVLREARHAELDRLRQEEERRRNGG